MPRRHQRALLGLAGAVLVVVVALLVAPAPALAAPVANDDRYPAFSGGTYTLTPLENDRTTFLSSGELTLCGVTQADPRYLYVEQVGDTIVVEIREGVRGATTIAYEACQSGRRDAAVITLDLTRLTPLSAVKVARTAGRVLFTNRNDVPVEVTYGNASSGRRPDGTRTIAAGGTLTVPTSRRSLFWVGRHLDRDATIFVGYSTVKNVQSAR